MVSYKAIFPVHAGQYICAALALCKHDRFATSLLKFQRASIICRNRCDACDCRPATVAEQRRCERRCSCLRSKVSQVLSVAKVVFDVTVNFEEQSGHVLATIKARLFIYPLQLLFFRLFLIFRLPHLLKLPTMLRL